VSAIILAPILYIAFKGFSFVPGQFPQSAFCSADIGQRLERQGHSEELLWRGCLLAAETGRYLTRFAPSRGLLRAKADSHGIPSCLSCHDGSKAADFGQMWTRFPRWNARTGEPEDFAQAIQKEIEFRYSGIRPNRSDNAITALHFYAAAKAAQAGLTFRLEAVDAAAPAGSEVERLGPSNDCRRKFEEKGWPRGPNAAAIIRGCNLVTETQKHVRGGIARQWRTDLACKSCHLDAGDKANAGSLAHAAVVLPHMYTAVNQPIRFDRRVLLCFSNSQNWYDLGVDAREITYINMYANWLAQKEGLPIGTLPEGRGIPLLYDAKGLGASFLAGERVYKTYCEACHGVNGLGGAGPVFNGVSPPPVAGPHSFSAAASITNPYRFAGFVYANMPFGADMQHPILTAQQSLDVAAYLTSLGRPADFTKANQLRVFVNHVWLKIVVTLGGWMSSLAAEAPAEAKQ
jgi:thiosulfate dehydrogenase